MNFIKKHKHDLSLAVVIVIAATHNTIVDGLVGLIWGAL